MQWWSGPRWNSRESSKLWGRQLKRPDGRKCWAGSEVLQAVDGWRNAGAAECRHRRPERSIVVRQVRLCAAVHTPVNCHCQLEKHPVRIQERQASKVRHAVSDPSRGQTSKCRWRHAQQRPTHAVTCPLLSLVHQQEQCCSNQSVNLQRRRRV